MTLFIRKSVGFGGRNKLEDVIKIQDYLNRNLAIPRLVIDGICEAKTIGAIRNFQTRFMLVPDGRIDPGGRTIKELQRRADLNKVQIPPPTVRYDPFWEGDSAHWPQPKKLRSLNSEFRTKVEDILDELEMRGFKPKIFYAWRSVEVQQELFRKKRTKVNFSFHNAQNPDGTPNAYAVDIIDRRWAWGAGAEANGFWSSLGQAAHNLNLYWGGDWATFKDWAHVQHLPNFELRRIRRESLLT